MVRPQSTLSGSLDGQHIDRVVLDGEDRPIARTRIEPNELFTDFVWEIVILRRERMTLREIDNRFQLRFNCVEPTGSLLGRMVVCPPLGIAAHIFRGLRKDDEAILHA